MIHQKTEKLHATNGSISDQQSLANLLESVNRSLEAGDEVDLEALVADHPHHANRLRELVPTLTALATWDRQEQRADDGQVPDSDCSFAGRELGDFRILNELGRGGMGAVYQAEQMSMGRRVALKILPFAALADGKSLQRFRNEVRAAATLEHPHIVSVYSVGEERGVHYYSMQLIEGQSLAQLISETRSELLDSHKEAPSTGSSGNPARYEDPTIESSIAPPATTTVEEQALLSTAINSVRDTQRHRKAAQLGIQAAEALQHAHDLGVLHRDIKPGNLMIGRDGELYVTDFGLARIEADAGMTMTGDIVGTLRYMAPEQALAKRVLVDHRADIYSLGATLYELLTLQPAFGESDRSELLKRIAFDEPSGLRKLDRHIPAELETIVLKAMGKNPEDRYQTAREVADDLQAYLDNRPIVAKPPTIVDRATKWSRRHRSFLLFAMVALLLLCVALGFAAAQIAIARELAQEEAQRAEENFQKARKIVDQLFLKTAQEMRDSPHTQEVQRVLLEDAANFYQSFLDAKSSDPEIRYNTAVAYHQLARIQGLLGESAKAVASESKAIKIMEEMVVEYPADPSFRKFLSQAYIATSWFSESGADVLRNAQKSLAILEQMVDDYPTSPELLVELARRYSNIGMSTYLHSDRVEAEAYLRNAIEILKTVEKRFPEVDVPEELADIYVKLGGVLLRTPVEHSRIEEAVECLRMAIDTYLDMGLDESDFEGFASAYAKLGKAFHKQGRTEQAVTECERSIETLESLIQQFPRHINVRSELSDGYLDRCEYLVELQDFPEAEKSARTALFHRTHIIALAPASVKHLGELAESWAELGELIYWLDNDDEEALDAFRQACDFHKEVVEHESSNPEDQMKFARFLNCCPAVQFRDGEHALELIKNAMRRSPNVPDSWLVLGAAFYRTGQWQEARAALEKAADIDPTNRACRMFQAMNYMQLGEPEKARETFEEAVDNARFRGLRSQYLQKEARELLGINTETKPEDGQP